MNDIGYLLTWTDIAIVAGGFLGGIAVCVLAILAVWRCFKNNPPGPRF